MSLPPTDGDPHYVKNDEGDWIGVMSYRVDLDDGSQLQLHPSWDQGWLSWNDSHMQGYRVVTNDTVAQWGQQWGPWE